MKKYTVSWSVEVTAYTPEMAAEKAKELQLTNNLFTVNGEEIDLDSKEYLTTKIAEIARRMYMMECGDDFLFSNRNGGRSLYDALQTEHTELCNKLMEK